MRKLVFVMKVQDFVIIVIKNFPSGLRLRVAVTTSNIPLAKMPPGNGLLNG